jgi:hypothetical protein
MGHLTKNFHVLLCLFQDGFTKPAFVLFCGLMTGWVLSVRHRFVTDLIYSSDNLHGRHWSCFHRFFSKHVWCLDELCLTLARMLFAVFCPEGTIITLAVDDTLCRKRGLNLFGAGMHHDACLSSKALKIVSWGHDWVVLSLVIIGPFWAPTKIFSLPIGFRLYRNRQGNAKQKKREAAGSRPASQRQQNKKRRQHKRRHAQPSQTHPGPTPLPHRTRPELALELIQRVAQAFPNLVFLVTGDNLYGGQSVLAHLPTNVHCISRVHVNGTLYEPAPTPRPGQLGRKPGKGRRLSSMNDWANDSSPWTKLAFDQYGLHAQLSVKTRQGLYYTAGKQRLLSFVLARDDTGKRPLSIFYATLLDWTPRQILAAYASRWSIEVAFENGKQLLGFDDPANRLPKAVERTAPMAMILLSLITLWFHQEGHRHVQFPFRPWYKKKKEPSFGDMLATLRRLSWSEFLLGATANRETLKSRITQLIEFVSRPC